MTADKTTSDTSTKSTDSGGHQSGPRTRQGKQGTAAWAAAQAVEQLGELVDRPVEHVTGIEKDDEDWKINVEVVETQRIPDSTDILASYEVQLNAEGDLSKFRRLRRYLRGRADD